VVLELFHQFLVHQFNTRRVAAADHIKDLETMVAVLMLALAVLISAVTLFRL
jgi:hypothetical protein